MDSINEPAGIGFEQPQSRCQLASVPGDVNDETTLFGSDALCFPHRVPTLFRERLVESRRLEAVALKNSLSQLSESWNRRLWKPIPSTSTRNVLAKILVNW